MKDKKTFDPVIHETRIMPTNGSIWFLFSKSGQLKTMGITDRQTNQTAMVAWRDFLDALEKLHLVIETGPNEEIDFTTGKL